MVYAVAQECGVKADMIEGCYPCTPRTGGNPSTLRYDWEKVLKKIGGEFPYNNVALIELEGGFLGLGPSTVSQSDVVCILQTWHRPVVLRKEVDDFTLIGACYVLGLMKLEEVETVVREDKLNRETLNIRW